MLTHCNWFIQFNNKISLFYSLHFSLILSFLLWYQKPSLGRRWLRFSYAPFLLWMREFQSFSSSFFFLVEDVSIFFVFFSFSSCWFLNFHFVPSLFFCIILHHFHFLRFLRNQDPTQDLSSPYCVHPHSVSIKPQLNTSNYQAWARAMRRGLGGKNKYKFVDGTILPPTFDDFIFFAWERCNNLIHS